VYETTHQINYQSKNLSKKEDGREGLSRFGRGSYVCR